MIIQRLEVKGEGKPSAILAFSKGLNVISGASDTGKSYVFQCIQFILGAEKAPKNIKQAEGYSSLEVTFLEDDGNHFVLKRELKNGSDVTLVEKGITKTLKPSHKGRANLSSYFLNKIDMQENVLVTGVESLNHASLTLRILERILLVDEARIITDHSPLGRGQQTEKTQEISFLKTILTGNDDSAVLNLKKRKESKKTIASKIENLTDFMKKYFSDDEGNKTRVTELNSALEAIENSITLADQELDSLLKKKSKEIEKRNLLASEFDSLNRELDDDITLLERFDLLLSKYRSDQERLEANSEAAKYIDKHYVANCPTCGNIIDNNSDINIEVILASNISEMRKIDNKVKGLDSTISEIKNHQNRVSNKIKSIKTEIIELDDGLDKNVSIKIIENRKLIGNPPLN